MGYSLFRAGYILLYERRCMCMREFIGRHLGKIIIGLILGVVTLGIFWIYRLFKD